MAITLYQNNDQIITLQGITNAQGTAVTGATITGVINDRTGASVSNGSMTFGDVAGSPGTYEGNVTAAFSPAVATTYTLVVSGSHLGASFTFQTGVSVAVRAI